MPEPEGGVRRRRGAQPGNSNARKHGFYAAARLTAQQAELLARARAGASLDDDIDLLRVEMARLVTSGDYDPRAVAALATAVTRAELARHRITGADDRAAMMSALRSVLSDLEGAANA